jgi:uncharacterized membrane protein YdjX (TVP38/TMEM64 family)
VTAGDSRPARRIVALCCLGALAAVVIPYLALGASFEDAATEMFQGQTSRAAAAAIGVLLLAADMVLPIPSSIVATGLGVALGWWAGMLAATAGLTIGCVLGFALGRSGGARLMRARAAVRERRLSELLERHGVTVLVLCRGVPILAEASVMAAGALGLPVWRCLAATTLANVAVAAVYAAIGTAAWDVSPMAAFLAALVVPGVLLAVSTAAWRLWTHGRLDAGHVADSSRN